MLDDWDLPRLTMNIAFQTRRHMPAKVRLFIDALVQRFRENDTKISGRAERRTSTNPKRTSAPWSIVGFGETRAHKQHLALRPYAPMATGFSPGLFRAPSPAYESPPPGHQFFTSEIKIFSSDVLYQ